MGNYNPRQNTRMRWKDARELEKFIFISAEFNFQNEETIQNASQDKLYFKIVNEIIKCSKNVKSEPLIIFDEDNGSIYVGYVNDDSTAYATYTASNSNYILEFEYHGDTDVLNIHLHDEIYVTADNIKTLFGQDITGTGNITIYRHQIYLTSNTTVVTIEILSSNNLKVDSAQDLTTLTKAYAGMEFTGLDSNTNKTYVVSYNGTLWRMYNGSAYYNPNNFSDRVTPI